MLFFKCQVLLQFSFITYFISQYLPKHAKNRSDKKEVPIQFTFQKYVMEISHLHKSSVHTEKTQPKNQNHKKTKTQTKHSCLPFQGRNSSNTSSDEILTYNNGIILLFST